MPNEFMDKDGRPQKFKLYNKNATQLLLKRIVNILLAVLKKENSEAKNAEEKWLQQAVAENLLDNSLAGQLYA